MIIAKNKLGTTSYLPREKMLISVYKGRFEIDLALEQLAKIAEFYKNNHVIGSVVDVKQLYGSFVKIFPYMKDTLNPIAIKSGLKYQVYVLSEDLIVKNLGIKLKKMATSFNLTSEVFTN